MNFLEAMNKTVEMAKEEKRPMYLYKQGGKFKWGISRQYWNDWLFKAFPGGRKILSNKGKEFLNKTKPQNG